MDEESIIEDMPQKKSRHRKKLLYNSLKEQMEFYFSDVNISKDRFISQLLQKDPYIDLSIFLRFNKIRGLTDKISDLYKAVSKSDILELSEDNMKVCRKTTIRVKENEDECTIYVERLPVDAEHDWLKNIFAKFGPVDYVSIPRYKHNKMIKGFAFIEFNTPEIAKKALEYFESIGCKLPTTMLPDQLVSISSFENEKSEKNQNILNQFTSEIKKECKTEMESTIETNNDCNNLESKVKQKKRKHVDDTSQDNINIKKKKVSEETETKQNLESEFVTEELKDSKKKKKKKQNQENEIDNTIEETNEAVEEIDLKENKKKKKKKQNQEPENTVEETTEKSETEVKDKKKKKNKDQVAENVVQETTVDDEGQEKTETKKSKKKPKKVTDPENTATVDENLEEADSKAEIESGEKRKRKRKKSKYSNDVQQFGLQVLSKKEWKQLRNKYLNLQRQKMQSLKEHLHRSRFTNVQNNVENNSSESMHNDKASAPRFEFIPGAIVHITLLDSFVDIKKFKNDVRSQPGLQYVDIKVGSNIGYIRFTDNTSAKKFCDSGNVNANMTILEGNEEKEYWDQIMQTRDQKFKKESKKQRGRDKLLRKAEKELGKHIRFDAE